MTIRLLSGIRISPGVDASSGILTMPAAQEADLVARGKAIYVGDRLDVRQVIDRATMPPRNWAILGDSLTEQCLGPGTADPHRFSNYGYWTWLNGRARGAWHLVSNLGLAGQTTETLAGRIVGEVLPLDVGGVIWLMSGNDIATGSATTAELIALTEGIIRSQITMGRVMVVGLIPPRAASGTGAFSTTAMLQQVHTVNRFVVDLAGRLPNLLVADTHSALANMATGVPASGVFRDSPAIHPGPLGADLLAEALWGVMQPLAGAPVPLAYLGAPYNLVPAALSSWTAATSGGTVTDTTSTSMTGSDGRADWVGTTITDMSAAGALRQWSCASITTNWSAGEEIIAGVEYEIDSATDLRTVNLQVRETGGTARNLESASEFNASSGLTLPAARPVRMAVALTPRIAIQTGTTALQMFVRAVAQSSSSVGVVRWRNPFLINLTRAGY